MHDCLRVPELLDLICYHSYHDSWKTRKSLSVLARTCRSFFEPAASYIWYQLDDFNPVIWCLGNDAYFSGERNIPLQLARELGPEDALVLKKYLHRVRILWMNETMSSQEVITEVYESLNILAGGELLFPNLHTLHLTVAPDSDCSIIPFLNCLMGPRLHTMDLESNPPVPRAFGPVLRTFLLNLAFRHRQLLHIHIKGFGSSSATVAETAHLWQNLVTLELGQINLPALRQIAALPALRSIDFSINSAGKQPSLSSRSPTAFPDFPPHPFPSLCELGMWGNGLRHCSHFLQLLKRGIPLERLSLMDTLHKPDTEEFSELTLVMAERISPAALTSLRINHATQATSTEENTPVLFSALKPLTKFHEFIFLNLFSPGGWGISDQEMDSLCAGLPRLQSCHFLSTSGVPETYSMTFRVLTSFGRHCKDLESLTITLDATIEPDSPDKPNTTPQQVSLSNLNVWDSPISEPMVETVARHIYQLFPSINDVSVDEDRNHEGGGDAIITGMGLIWRKVDELVQSWLYEDEVGKEAS